MADDVRITAASERMAADPVAAVSIVEAIATPRNRGLGYQRLAAALPASERDRKRTLLDRATQQVHEGAADSEGRVYVLGQIAESWLNLGEVEKARALILEGIKSLEAVPPARRWLNQSFLVTGGTDRARQGLVPRQGHHQPRWSPRRYRLAAIAVSLANDHPAQAERVFQLFDDRSDPQAACDTRTQLVLRLCRGWPGPIRNGCDGSSPG